MMRAVSAFMGVYLTMWVFATAGLSLTGMDYPTTTSAADTATGGVGPELADIGPFDNFMWVNPAGRIILSFCMLAGRLEVVTLLLIFAPAYSPR
jgi:trk system potassium uptake protein TrkH